MSDISDPDASAQQYPEVPGVPDLSFADQPRLELDKLLGDVAGRAQDVLATQGRLRALMSAHASVASELGLPEVLQHIVEAARGLVEARYAALGVLGDHGLLEQFVHVGIDPATVERIGDPPAGRGILGLLTSDPRPVRLANLGEHPAATGFPSGHPAMDSFLGVPIRIRGRLYGNLYLTGSANGEFSDEDEQLAVALAATAGVAIGNARQYEQSEQRHRWLAASTAVTRQLFAGQHEHSLDLVLDAAQRSADADFSTLALFSDKAWDPDQQLQVKASSGVMAEHLLGLVVDLETSIAGKVARSGEPVLTADYAESGTVDLPLQVGSVIVVPLVSGETVIGTLSIGRLAGRPGFTAADMEHVAGFAGHAGIAMELDRVRTDQQTGRMDDEHDRISADLNEHVVQRLFTVGTGLQGLLALSTRQVVRDRVTGYIGVLDDIINRIRSTVYDDAPGKQPTSLSERLLTAVDDETSALGFPVQTTFSGDIGRDLPLALTDDVVTVTREALAIVALHARAHHADLVVSVADDLLTLEIVDDGPGVGAPARVEALPVFRRRAEGHDGTLENTTPPGGGTRLTWTARIPAAS